MNMNELDDFLDRTGIDLLPCQKEILKRAVAGEKLYVIFPPFNGRFYFKNLLYAIQMLLSKGEERHNDYSRS